MERTSWRRLDEPEYSTIWDVVNDGFGFQPSTAPSMWPGFREPPPFITFQFDYGFNDNDIDEFYTLMNSHLIRASGKEEWLFALDWQHDCYAYSPEQLLKHGPSFPMYTGLFPDGDYAITLASDARFGTLGHPWEQSICVFGEELVPLLVQERPRLLSSILRQSSAL